MLTYFNTLFAHVYICSHIFSMCFHTRSIFWHTGLRGWPPLGQLTQFSFAPICRILRKLQRLFRRKQLKHFPRLNSNYRKLNTDSQQQFKRLLGNHEATILKASDDGGILYLQKKDGRRRICYMVCNFMLIPRNCCRNSFSAINFKIRR